MASYNPFARTPQSAALDQALFKLQQSAFSRGFYPGGQGYYYLGGRPMISGTSPIYDTSGKLVYTGTGNAIQGNTGGASGVGGGGVAGYGDPRNPYFSTQVIHEPEARGIVEQNMRAANETAATGRDALAKAVEDFRALQEPLKASVEKQQNFLSDLYDAGGLQGRYDTTLNNFEQASRDLANKSIASASAHLPTTAGLGSNYLSGLFSRASDAQERLLRDVAAQRLQEEPMLANIRMAALGKDIPLANAYYQSLVSPLITAQQYEQGNLGNILSAIQGLKGTTQSFLGTDSGFQPTISLSTTRYPMGGVNYSNTGTPNLTESTYLDGLYKNYAGNQSQARSKTPQFTYDMWGNRSDSPYFDRNSVASGQLNYAAGQIANMPSWMLNPYGALGLGTPVSSSGGSPVSSTPNIESYYTTGNELYGGYRYNDNVTAASPYGEIPGLPTFAPGSLGQPGSYPIGFGDTLSNIYDYLFPQGYTPQNNTQTGPSIEDLQAAILSGSY